MSRESQIEIELFFVISKRGTSGDIRRMWMDLGKLFCGFTRSVISSFAFVTAFASSVTKDDFVHAACQNSCKLFSTFWSRSSGVVDSVFWSSAITWGNSHNNRFCSSGLWSFSLLCRYSSSVLQIIKESLFQTKSFLKFYLKAIATSLIHMIRQ